MCGIAGALLAAPAEGARLLAERMAAELRHRGPDDAGSWAAAGIGLAMRRLSIIDLEHGHQPMSSGDHTLIFNGEIYNYRALAAELERGGVRLRTRSDTEVVLELVRANGLRAALDKLEGMFAIALWDASAETLHLVRDRLGKKPLYWMAGDRFLFASEAKALLAVLDRGPDLDEQAIHDYLTLRYVPAPSTPWRGIHKLEPGHLLTVRRDGTPNVTRWWSVDFVSEEADPQRDYPGEFEALLLGAVEKRLVASDVPVGVLLSGGLDSSAISAAAVELGHRQFHTFSVGFGDGGEYDERVWARKTAEHIGSEHHEVVIGQAEFIGFLSEMARAADEPLADLASVPLHFVARLAREHVKVVLSGEGSDEVLAGYDLDQLAARLERLRAVARLPRLLLGAAATIVRGRRGRSLGALAQRGWSGYLRSIPAHMTHVFDEQEKELLELFGGPHLRSTDELIRSWYDDAPSAHPIDQLQQVYCRSWLPEELLMKADKMTMATSLELRVPFLDHALVEWSARAPLAWKVGDTTSGWSSKRILRQFASERLPPQVVARPKRGFPVPAAEWLAGPLGDDLAGRIEVGPVRDLLEIDPASVLASARESALGATKMWTIVVLDEWLRAWSD